jgi:hypothetical protein
MSESGATETTESEPLPVRAVTIFSSGVAYTLREGTVEAGEAKVSLTFRTTQVSDILKSLVLLDEAGTVRAATYPSRDPVGRSLQSFAVDVTGNPSRADLLRQLRGATLSATTISGETLTGRIVGIETREEYLPDAHRSMTIETLTLLGDEGLAAVPLDKVRLLRLLDPRLDREFRDALTVLASGSDDNRRQVTLTFSGEQQRTVRVGYVAEAPLWKVSYRLVLDDAEGEGGGNVAAKPYLQGWAMVENTSDDDWNEVRLSLVSGRPVSFIQDLYQPLYVPRPVVPPDIIASPFPQMHSGNLLDEGGVMEADMLAFGAPVASAMPAAPPAAAPMAKGRGRGGGGYVEERQEMAKRNMAQFQNSAPAQAEGKGAGELFEYHVSTPVTLKRQQAAMIPIVSGEIDGEKLSLYNADSDPRFPLNAVRLKNNTELHLKGGPVTIFDGGVYGGDARMEEIPPGDSRLITYAVDLAVEGERQQTHRRRNEFTLRIQNGILTITSRQREETIYTLKNKAKKARLILVEHPYRADWTLVEPTEPTERTADRYRFAVRVEAGKSGTLKVVTETPVAQTVALLVGDENVLVQYAANGTVSPKLREALNGVVERRRKHRELDTAARKVDKERESIAQEQERIRANMGAVDRESALYRRYMDQLDKQETRIQELLAESEERWNAVQTAMDDIESYIASLNLVED